MAEETLNTQQTAATTGGNKNRWLWTRHLPAYLFLGGWSLFTVFTIGWLALGAVRRMARERRRDLQTEAEVAGA